VRWFSVSPAVAVLFGGRELLGAVSNKFRSSNVTEQKIIIYLFERRYRYIPVFNKQHRIEVVHNYFGKSHLKRLLKKFWMSEM